MNQIQQAECFIFYFDVIGIADLYIKDPKIIDSLVDWQREVRDEFYFGHGDTTCKTLFDNVWARITTTRPESDIYSVLDFAGKTMSLAKKHGFKNFFGSITYGSHSYALVDRTLVSLNDSTDILKQHIDSLSPPHIRAALTEKWSAALFKNGMHPMTNSIWVSEEALFGQNLHDVINYSGMPCEYKVNQNLIVDLLDQNFSIGKVWPFKESRFQFISVK
jgi:hypothetical protein